uniref:EEF1A lysine methyltransferase 4 n=1 Tax=Tanacetum cinerariifolium TaxID=118510 RepID=A0A6L2MIN0_TANCI|nr:EEF1A lysine methyltransferase 4 [Tanacetum cinerariifolium]
MVKVEEEEEEEEEDIKVMEDDMVNLSFTYESFNVVIEKGTMDLRPNAVNKGMGLLQGVHRVLKPNNEELHWMAQEVRGYVEVVLNSLGANVPKVFTLSLLSMISSIQLSC